MSNVTPRELKWLFKFLHQEISRDYGWTETQTMDWIASEEGQRKLVKVLRGITISLVDPKTNRFREQIFLGAGNESLKRVRELHDRLDYGLNLLSGIQQEGLQGTDYDHRGVLRDYGEIQEVVTDIAIALTGV